MRIFLLLLSAIALFIACSENDGSVNKGEINYQDGFKYLKNLNVSDAKMIYRKSSITRSADYGTYWKLDFEGNESKLVIKDSIGQDHNIGIVKIIKLSDRILLVDPDPMAIINLLYQPGPDDFISVPIQGYLLIADIQTEKLYKWPKEIYIDIYGLRNYDVLKSTTDNQRNVYLVNGRQNEELNQIYKLDITILRFSLCYLTDNFLLISQ